VPFLREVYAVMQTNRFELLRSCFFTEVHGCEPGMTDETYSVGLRVFSCFSIFVGQSSAPAYCCTLDAMLCIGYCVCFGVALRHMTREEWWSPESRRCLVFQS